MLILKYKKLLQNQLGISLIEIIFGIAIMIIILIPIYSSLSMGSKSYQYNMAQSQNIISTRETLNAIAGELRYASAISIVAGTTSTMPNAQITYTVGTQSRTIYAIAGATSTTYTLVIAYNGVIQKKIAPSDLQSITIKRDATNTKELTITTKFNNFSYINSPAMTSSTTIVMSNM